MLRIALCAVVASATTVHAQAPLPPPRPSELRRDATPSKDRGRTDKPANQPAPSVAKPDAAAPSPAPSAAASPIGAAGAETASQGCLAKLAAIPGHRIRAATTPQNEEAGCRVTEPVTVEALAIRGRSGPASVRLEGPPLLSCAMAEALASWVDTGLAPLARGHFDAEVQALKVGGGHECRRRNRSSSGPLSEHAGGKALDIMAFVIGTGSQAVTVTVAKPGGLAASRFLDSVRDSACGAFSTVLGPGSDAAHADHLHLDIQDRRSQASRFCQ